MNFVIFCVLCFIAWKIDEITDHLKAEKPDQPSRASVSKTSQSNVKPKTSQSNDVRPKAANKPMVDRRKRR